MRVISGIAKGRTLKPAGAATRPITDRAKTSLFNILGARVVDANVLDLFAGAGSVGIEALSRGARAATFVELDREALNAIRANLETTKLANRANIMRLDVFKFIRRASVIASEAKQSPNPNIEIASSHKSLLATTRYDVIYVAPPQYRGLWAETLAMLDGLDLLTENGVVVAQIHPKEYKELALTKLELFDQRKYGSTMLCFYRKADKATRRLGDTECA
jgi:16S rRNA (guanine966-N2)-methyltransferase